MIKLKTFKEELDTNIEEISRAEIIWGTPFPEEYKAFLLKNNGIIVYPDFPRIDTDRNSELWRIERLMSIGDIILQKKYSMEYTYNEEHDSEDLEKYGLSLDYLLTFAIGQRGAYYINLQSNDLGQIYFCNYSDGDGIIKIKTNSFSTFMASLFVPKDEEEDFDPNLEMTGSYYAGHKIFSESLYQTPKNPELGFERFKEVFARFVDLKYPELAYQNVMATYVYDQLRLEFLLSKGYMIDGLLNRARHPEIIKFLIIEKGLDINKIHRGRYPIQSYLMETSYSFIENSYKLIDALLALGIEIDWSVLDDTDAPLIKQLERLHELYVKHKLEDKNWWIKEGRPSGHEPRFRSKLIEEKLGIQ